MDSGRATTSRGSRGHAEPCWSQLGVLVRAEAPTRESPRLAALTKQQQEGVCFLSHSLPSLLWSPAPFLYRRGTHAHRAKQLLTNMRADGTTRKGKLISGRRFLSDLALQGQGDAHWCSHNPGLLMTFASSQPDPNGPFSSW